MRPRRACGFVCIVILAGTGEGLASPREFLRELVGVATPSDLAGSCIEKILYCGEGRDVKQVARSSKQISRVCNCYSLFLSLISL